MESRLPNRFGKDRPSEEQLRAWVKEGYSDTEIGILAGESLGIAPATKQTVRTWRKSAGIEREQRAPDRDYTRYRPRNVRKPHSNGAFDNHLYDYGRIQMGIPIPESSRRSVEKFVAILKAENGIVVYNEDDGYQVVPRVPEDPDDVIYRPAPDVTDS